MDSFKELKNKHEREQNQHWKALKAELEKLRGKYGTSMIELAEGLSISRQPLYDFMNEPESGLRKVSRSDLLNLWAYITDPVEYKDKKLNEAHKEARRQLRQTGPDKLLEAAGFLPRQGVDGQITIDDPQIKRIVSRLSSKWIQDDALRAYLVDGILDRVLDQGRIDRKSYIERLNADKRRERQIIDNWPLGEALHKDEYLQDELIQKYRQAIRKLVEAGKTEFVRSELFELYESILEHHIINKSSDSKVEMLDCQFRTLSNRLIFKGTDFEEYGKNAEVRFSFNPKGDIYNDSEAALFPRVTQVTINCKFIYKNDIELQQGEVFFEHSSTATHIENMLLAIKSGLAYPLDIAGFFIRATGRTAKSLARVSVALAHEEAKRDELVGKVHKGWWVSSNTITGILRSVEDAVRRWLSNESIDSSKYYKACQDLAALTKSLYSVKSSLYEEISMYEDFSGLKLPKSSKIIGILEENIRSGETLKDKLIQAYFRKHQVNLFNRIAEAKLMLVHAALIEGKLEKAKAYISDIESLLSLPEEISETGNPYRYILGVHASACLMRFNFITGNQEFLIGKQWNNVVEFTLENCVKRLRQYTRRVGNIDFDTYFSASHFFGVIGQLELYTSEADHDNLKDSITYLLEAAHYSSRIGHFRRAAQWLINATRVCCRIGDKEKASRIFDIAIQILQDQYKSESIEIGELSSNKSWISANRFLGRGELDLLNNNFNDALGNFKKALIMSLSSGFTRIVPDCLYNMSRACKNMSGSYERPNEEISSTIYWKPIEEWERDNIEIKLREHLQEIGLLENQNPSPTEVDWESSAERWKENAASLCNSWAQRAGFDTHPFETLIRQGKFLCRSTHS